MWTKIGVKTQFHEYFQSFNKYRDFVYDNRPFPIWTFREFIEFSEKKKSSVIFIVLQEFNFFQFPMKKVFFITISMFLYTFSFVEFRETQWKIYK